MSNTALFDDGPKLMKCDGCGKYFEEPMLKKCRACGKYYCPDCRMVHDCREASIAPVIICEDSDFVPPRSDSLRREQYAPIEFIDTDGSSIGSASLRGRRGFGEEPRPAPPVQPISVNISFNESPGGIRARGHPQEFDACPPPPMPEIRGRSTARMPERDASFGNETPYIRKPDYSPYPSYSAPDSYAEAPLYYPEAAPAQNPLQTLRADELRCDECGRVWKKSELRKCKKCGAVLCPDCRGKHKCKKTQKKPEPAGPVSYQVQEPHKEPAAKKERKSKKKVIAMLIVAAILIVAVIIAILMMPGISH